jgi:hypothetical protein
MRRFGPDILLANNYNIVSISFRAYDRPYSSMIELVVTPPGQPGAPTHLVGRCSAEEWGILVARYETEPTPAVDRFGEALPAPPAELPPPPRPPEQAPADEASVEPTSTERPMSRISMASE